MGESQHHQSTATSPTLPAIKNTAATTVGEIVEVVQGDRIVRSTGRKDRHSKVCTAKGPRDRRVRLSAHTAIQFYDVQDRLGYDRPSKAVDWLIKKAKAAIDELAELPAWNSATVTTTAAATTVSAKSRATKTARRQDQQNSNASDGREYGFTMETVEVGSGSGNNKIAAATTTEVTRMVAGEVQTMQQQQQISSSFLPPSMDSDSIADTIKSFFPMGTSTEETASPTIQFQSYPPDLLSRTSSSRNQDLRLSLQSFQEPSILLQHHGQGHGAQNEQEQVIFSGNPTTHHHDHSFDMPSSAGWSDHPHPAEINRLHRMVTWNNAGAAADVGDTGGAGNEGVGFIFNTPLPPSTVSLPLLQPFFGQNQFFTQRGPLQSSNTPSLRAWIDPAITADHHYHQQFHQQSAISGIGFTATPVGADGFSGFRVPARIQGEEEEHVGIHHRPSSASSDSRH